MNKKVITNWILVLTFNDCIYQWCFAWHNERLYGDDDSA